MRHYVPLCSRFVTPSHAGPHDLVVGGPDEESGSTLSILDKWGLKTTRTAPSISIVTYTLSDIPFIVPVSVYACVAFPTGTMPKSAERGFPRIPHQPWGEVSSTKFFSRLAMLAVLFHGKIPVFAFLLSYGVLVDATVCPHCNKTLSCRRDMWVQPVLSSSSSMRMPRSLTPRSWAPLRRSSTH